MDALTEAQLAAELQCTTCRQYRLWVTFPDRRTRRLCRECYNRRQNRRNQLRRQLRREEKMVAVVRVREAQG